MEEKVESVKIALQHINIAEVAREAEVAESTLRYDLNKLERALPMVLANQKPGPLSRSQASSAPVEPTEATRPGACSVCGGQVRKNGTYTVLVNDMLKSKKVGFLRIYTAHRGKPQ